MICRRGNSAFSPSICLASCLHVWCTSTTISEANSLRRREARWLTEVFHKAIHHLLTTARLTVEREGESGRSDLQTKTRCVIKSRWWRPSTHLYTERSSLYTSTAGFLCCFDLKEIAHPKWQLCHYLLMLMLFQTYLLLFFSETFNRDA